MNSINNLSPNFHGKAKTAQGNEYTKSDKYKRYGMGAGLLAGGALAYWQLEDFRGKKKVSIDDKGNKLIYRDTSNRRSYIRQLEEMNRSLNFFGKAKERKAIKTGIRGVLGAIVLSGMFVGAMIGKAFDSRNNHKAAMQADIEAQTTK